MSDARMLYPGLRAFRRDESDLFFGREGCVDSMIDRLAATRFLAVLGASGSGKSSLVRTGLLDALELGFNSRAGSDWLVAEMHPGVDPMAALATALLNAKGIHYESIDAELLADALRRGPRSVVEWCLAGHLPPGHNLLILADQFEELFRYGNYAQRETAEAFVSLLQECADAAEAPISVVLTMRSEFLAACTLFDGLAERINRGLYLTPRMTRDECKMAIVGPASVGEFVVAPGLVNRLLNDMTSFAPWEESDAKDQIERLSRRADQLPLMQHVLNRLWLRAREKGGNIELTEADYDAVGGLKGALDEHGAAIIARLGRDHEAVVEHVFRALVIGTSAAAAVRRPTLFGEIVGLARSDADTVSRIIDEFRAPQCNFLQPPLSIPLTDTTIVDLSHESLIRQWSRLTEWTVKEARSSDYWLRLCGRAERHAAGEGGLLSGLDLAMFSAWWDSELPSPSWQQRHGGDFAQADSYLTESRRVHDAAEATRIEAEQREKTSLRRRLAIWTSLALLTTTSAIGAGYAALLFNDQKGVAEGATAEAVRERKQAQTAERRAFEFAKKEQVARLKEAEQRQIADERERAAQRSEAAAKAEKAKAQNAAIFAKRAEASAVAARGVSDSMRIRADAALADAEAARASALASLAAERKERVEKERFQIAFQKSVALLTPEQKAANPELVDSADRLAANNVKLAANPGGDGSPNGLSPSKFNTSREGPVIEAREVDPALLDSLRNDLNNPASPATVRLARLGIERRINEVARLRAQIASPGANAATLASFVDAANELGWMHATNRDVEAARALWTEMRRATARIPLRPSATMANEAQLKLALLQYQIAFLSRDAEGVKGADKISSQFADAVVADRDATARGLGLAFRNAHYLAYEEPEKSSARADKIAGACRIAERIAALAPRDSVGIRSQARCLWARGYIANDSNRSAGTALFEQAADLLREAHAARPEDQIVSASLFEALGKLVLQYGSAATRARDAARDEALAVLRTGFTARALTSYVPAYVLRESYDSITFTEFAARDEELRFYQAVARSVESAAAAFPRGGPGYVFADAQRRISEALDRAPSKKADVEAYYTASIANFDRSAEMAQLAAGYKSSPLPGFSEVPSNICRMRYGLMTVLINRREVDKALAAFKSLRDTCEPALAAYPYDYYLRRTIILANAKIGGLLVREKRYAEAKPYLDYASHWSEADSTLLLSEMYRAGNGVAADAKTADELKKTASGQGFKKFTVPTDFGGVKYPFDVYIANWPSEYYSADKMNLPGIMDQVKWVKNARGGDIPQDVIDSFNKLQKIAIENDVSYTDLAVYALDAAKKEEAATSGPAAQGPTEAEAQPIVAAMRQTKFKVDRTLNTDSAGLALEGFDAVSYTQGDKPVVGKPAIFALWKGALWLFSSQANRATFLRNPARYAPQYGGFCAADVKSSKYNGDAEIFAVVDGKLYLFGSNSEKTEWTADFVESRAAANRGWKRIASTDGKPKSNNALSTLILKALPTLKTTVAPVKPLPARTSPVELSPADQLQANYGSATTNIAALEKLTAPSDRQKLAFALGNRAWYLVQLKRAREGLADADRALAIDPDLWWVQGNRAVALLVLGKVSEAIVSARSIADKPGPNGPGAMCTFILEDIKTLRTLKIGKERDLARIERALPCTPSGPAAPPPHK